MRARGISTARTAATMKSAGTSPIRWPWLPGANDWNTMMRPWMTLDQMVNWMRLQFASGSRAAAIRKMPRVA
jgi:hypothetical protein